MTYLDYLLPVSFWVSQGVFLVYALKGVRNRYILFTIIDFVTTDIQVGSHKSGVDFSFMRTVHLLLYILLIDCCATSGT